MTTRRCEGWHLLIPTGAPNGVNVISSLLRVTLSASCFLRTMSGSLRGEKLVSCCELGKREESLEYPLPITENRHAPSIHSQRTIEDDEKSCVCSGGHYAFNLFRSPST